MVLNARRNGLGLQVVRDLTPDLPPAYRPPRACDDETLICHGIIYAFPVWEISSKTGLILLYRTNPVTGELVLNRAGEPIPAGQVAHADLARPDARPRIVYDYVGQTIRALEVREAEHVEEKCWADIRAGRAIVIAEGEWDKAERDRREIAAITGMRPRFNKEYNENNRDRIEIWRQVQMRHARDDALKRARWIPLPQRTALALRAAELDVVGAGLDGREPRYPLSVLGRALAAAGRWIWSRPVARRAGLAVVAGSLAGPTVAVGLLSAGWPAQVAGPAGAAAGVVLTAATARKNHRKRRRRR